MLLLSITFSFIVLTVMTSSKISTMIKKINNKVYSSTIIRLSAMKNKNSNIVVIESMSMPSDLIQLIHNGEDFELNVIQGRVDKTRNVNIVHPLEIDTHINHFHLMDFPNGYYFHSKTFTPFKEFDRFKNFFDVFSNVFKITLNPLLDRSSYIIAKEEIFLIENSEKACVDHLDGIKETLPKSQWGEFTENVNYEGFVSSDYKLIRYHVRSSEENVEFEYEIMYSIDDPSKNNQVKETEVLSANRRIEGELFTFDNFQFVSQIRIDHFTSEIIEGKKKLEIIDVIPDQLDLIFASISIRLQDKLDVTVTSGNIEDFFEISVHEGVEVQNPVVPFTYENKKSYKLHFKLKTTDVFFTQNNFTTLNIEIKYQLRKRLLNFESYENESEFGYKFPCGVIIIGDMYTITNHVYFNMPCIDGTMPFNIIALSWLIYGFIFIQILNVFLGNSGNFAKNIFQSIRDRFMAKWGFLFQR